MKLLGENRGKVLDIGLGNNYLDMSPNAQVTKVKINKLKYIKLKSFCTANEMINKMKRQHTEQKKLFAKHQSDMGLIMKNIRNPYNSVA